MFTNDSGQIIAEMEVLGMEVPENKTQSELCSQASWSVKNS